jgi:hypothetical protein
MNMLPHLPKLPSHVRRGWMPVAERQRTLLVDEFAPAYAKQSPRRCAYGMLADDRRGVIGAAIDFAECRGQWRGKASFSRL